MEVIAQLQAERTQLYKDIYDGIIPKRVPIEVVIAWDAGIEYANMNLKEAQWDDSQYYEFFDKVCKDFPTDKAPISRTLRTPIHYQILESKCFVMSKQGNMQHPEVHALEPEEYDEFIADPYKCMVNKLLPRLYKGLDTGGLDSALTLAKAYKAYSDIHAKMAAVAIAMSEKYGYVTLPPGRSISAPFDFLADLIRSFTRVVIDMRRIPEKLEQACEAIIPYMNKIGVGPTSSYYGRTFIPLHMGPYMSRKQFERFWWPSFQTMMQYFESKKVGVNLFVEHDWTDKLDYLASLEGRVMMQFEYGDAKRINQALGKKHIVSGLFPVTMLQTATKQECCDKAKELIEELAPGGGFIFGTDKVVYSLEGNIAENLQAVIETVKTYGVY